MADHLARIDARLAELRCELVGDRGLDEATESARAELVLHDIDVALDERTRLTTARALHALDFQTPTPR